MRFLLNLTAFLALSALVCASAAFAQNTTLLPREPAAIAQSVLSSRPGSVAVGVWQGGKAAYGMHSTAATPPAADSALFEIGSISKVFTGVLLAQAVERGDLRLSDTLGKLLAGRLNVIAPAVASITLEQLVTHRSCLPRLSLDLTAKLKTSSPAELSNPYRSYSRVQLWQAVAEQQLSSAPPCDASYSNYGFAVLGELLAQHYGKPWSALVHERITQPLGMSQTVQALGKYPLTAAFNGATPAPPWDFDAYAGAGALRSTSADMLLFGRALLAGASGPLGAAAVRALTPLAGKDGAEIGYAITVQGAPGQRTYSHNGGTGGYRALLMLHEGAVPSEQRVLVVLASNAESEANIGQLQLAINAERYPVSSAKFEVDASDLVAFAGVYRVKKDLAFTFVVQNGELYARITGQGYNALAASAANTFTLAAVGAQFVFERAASGDGQAQRVTLMQGGQTIKAERTSEPAPQVALLRNEVLQAYAGRYLLAPGAEFEVRVVGGQLLVKLSGQGSVPVFAVPGKADRFAYDVVAAELQFEREPSNDPEGKVVALVLHQNGAHRAIKQP
jgi:serine-type D-Ala-D-Ala carboxypeptidase/endopeptidase